MVLGLKLRDANQRHKAGRGLAATGVLLLAVALFTLSNFRGVVNRPATSAPGALASIGWAAPWVGRGAAQACTSTPAPEPSMLRFSQAAAAAAALRAASTYVAAACPPALATMAVRPPPYEARLTGNACEPPLARGAVELLSSLLRPNAAALEWGAGASSLWLLSGRVSRLISIEHDARRSGRVREALEAALGAAYVDERWELHVVPPAAPVLTFLQAESYEHYFRRYGDASLLDGQDASFDLVLLGGQARAGCVARALRALRPQGAALVLPDAQRAAYAGVDALVPAHWLRYEAPGAPGGSRTAVWVSCEPGRCASAATA